jgi:MFS family permease
MTTAPTDTDQAWHSGISRYQWNVLVATTLGWALDGFDYSLFTQVAGPATTELLGTPSTFYSGLAVTIFLTGWAVGAIFFGVVADYVGRVRVLITGVLLFSVFTALSVVVVNYAEFVTFRFIAGIGSGVELPIGAALVAEAWSSSRHRAKASGVMMSGLALGALLAAVVYNFVGHLGWRWTMAFGLIPALLVLFIRRNVHEPETMAEVKASRARRKTERAAGAAKQGSDRFVLTQLFTPPMLKTTVACTLICVGALFAF